MLYVWNLLRNLKYIFLFMKITFMLLENSTINKKILQSIAEFGFGGKCEI